MPGHSLLTALRLAESCARSSSERRFSSPCFGSIKMYQAAPAHTRPLSHMEVLVISFGFLHGAQGCPSVRTPSSCSFGSKPPASGTFPCSPPTHPAQVLILHSRLLSSPGTDSAIRPSPHVDRPPSYCSWTLMSHSRCLPYRDGPLALSLA